MNRKFFFMALLLCALGSKAQTVANANFGATVYAKQQMTDNESPTYMVNWTTTNNGMKLNNNQAPISNHVTTLNIDATAIPGTIQSISVYANGKEAIAGPLYFNGRNTSTPAGGSASVYASNGQSDVVMVEGESKTCKAYLLPVALTNGVKVTVHTNDGKFYSQDFSESISAGATKDLTITSTTANNLWMATIPGNTYFSFVSTPGAHDAATSGVTSYTSASKCQDMTIKQLLDAGVRAFDIRPGYYYKAEINENNLYIYHGQVSTNVLYKDAMKDLVEFVENNPSEAISIIMVKENCKPTTDVFGSWTDRSSEMWTVVNAVQEQYKSYMKVLDHSYYTLDDFRGKICYVNRTGTSVPYTTQILNWPDNEIVSDYSLTVGLCSAYVQDAYNLNGENKKTAVKEMLQLSSGNTTYKNIHYNYCSSANKPASYANDTNPDITSYLNGGNITGPTGYVYADFIGSSNNGGAALLTAIVNQNYRYVYNGRSASDKATTDVNWDLNQGSGVAWTKKGNWTDAHGTQNGIVYVTENYSGWGSQEQTDFSLLRSIFLPAGTYRLQGYAMYNGTLGGARLVAKANNKVIGNTNIVAGTLSDSAAGEGESDDLRKAANAFGSDNSLYTVYFVLPEGAEVTLGFEGRHTAYRQWFVAGPVSYEKIERIEASEDKPADVTCLIANPTIFNMSQGSTPNGWTCYARTAGNGNYTTGTGDTQIENWHGTPANAKFDYYQTLDLPAGKYTLGADLLYRSGQGDEVGLYVYDVTTRARVTVSPTIVDAALHPVSLDFTTTGGQVNIGIINLKAMTGDWFAADNFTLSYKGLQDEKRTTATGKYGTICLPYSTSATGADLFTVNLNDEKDAIVLTPLEGETEAGTPYLYKATADTQTFTYRAGQVVLSPTVTDLLTGVFTPTPVPVGSYVMQTPDGVQKFYKVYEGQQPTLSAYKAYLTAPGETQIKAFNISCGDEETAVNALHALSTDHAKIYDLNGKKMNSLQKGVNIVNGVKVLVK